MIPKSPKLDFGLFLRPFKPNTWEGILVIVFIGILIHLLTFKFLRKYNVKTGYQIVVFTGWFFFALINAYFGGALTMFFASEVSLPFNSIKEVLQNVPEWTLLSIIGNEVYYKLPALEVKKN